MLNKRPIFIVGFARGGSNILLNLLRSHPEVCSPRGETQEVFRAKADESAATRLAKRLRYLPIVLAERSDVFNIRLWAPRRPFRRVSRRQIDRVLHHEKLRARAPGQNLYKEDGVEYTREEIVNARLLCKNLNGLIYLSPGFAEMYPDATFFALVRHGLAVCEGHIRRGYAPEVIAARYEEGCREITAQAATLPAYHVLRYEDLVADPVTAMRTIYEQAGLDISKVRKVRLETKKVMGPDGRRSDAQGAGEKRVVWYDIEDMPRHFVRNANENQIRRLTADQRRVITAACRESLERFGYLEAS